ncbi:hypothetical protein BDU57DRAFT_509188 [Ampelomyces quisqualis]|uniref:Uncharacterized protein n=1 Tax=Ampelomyces quisqualis TaxID=50730 RepID=A0A6A5R0V5_AMPQU|nr:hypothetical protein BDU57DRAFT_509188 [Ampelomyces quisqualis]
MPPKDAALRNSSTHRTPLSENGSENELYLTADTGSDTTDIYYTPPTSTAMSPALSATSSAPAIDSNTALALQPTTTAPAVTSGAALPAVDPRVANISVREYIYFLPHPLPPGTQIPYSIFLPGHNPQKFPVTTLFEPTRTTVLTSPRSTFIDLRFLKPTTLGQPTSGCNLEWGFAGSSQATQLGGGKSHSVWTHWVDSRVAIGGQVPVDEGDMYPINDALTLEHGHAFHPALRRVSGHEEMWRDIPVTITSPTPFTTASAKKAAAKSTTHVPLARHKICMVLRHSSNISRGLIIRLGQFIQGILVKENEVTAERWEWTVTGGWKRTERVGQHFVPCGVAMDREGEKELGVGGKVTYKDWVWVVEESWRW